MFFKVASVCLDDSFAHSRLHLAEIEISLDKFRYVYSGMFIPVLFHLNVCQQNRRNEYTPDHAKTQFTFITDTLYSFLHLCALLLSPSPFVSVLQCTTHQLYVTRQKNLSKPNHFITETHSLHCCHHIS